MVFLHTTYLSRHPSHAVCLSESGRAKFSSLLAPAKAQLLAAAAQLCIAALSTQILQRILPRNTGGIPEQPALLPVLIPLGLETCWFSYNLQDRIFVKEAVAVLYMLSLWVYIGQLAQL